VLVVSKPSFTSDAVPLSMTIIHIQIIIFGWLSLSPLCSPSEHSHFIVVEGLQPVMISLKVMT